MEPKRFPILKDSLEQWFAEKGDDVFPSYDTTRGEFAYQQRYQLLKTALAPFHGIVEKGALLKSALQWQAAARKAVQKSMDEKDWKAAYTELDKLDELVYLNNHGVGHVDRVVKRTSELLIESSCELTAYEGYLLLAAIQFHDVGNVFGREGHELKCRQIMAENCKHIIRDSAERHTITDIASVHGGCCGPSKDTITSLIDGILLNQPVRRQLLAAILRFADELADDSSRADQTALEKGLIISGGEIFHRYSEALHSVKIERNVVTLCFEFSSEFAVKPLIKDGKPRFLLDEIYYRTVKLERERRYCMRFMRPHFIIDRVRVAILIRSPTDPRHRESVTYTLEEKGYPYEVPENIRAVNPGLLTGSQMRRRLNKEWKAP